MKKEIKNYLLNIITVIFCALSVNAQTTILPVNSYGVWDRSNAYDISVNTDYNYLRGKSADVNWEDVQPNNTNQYDWSEIQTILQEAFNNNQMVNISVGVGPDAPVWIYANGVPSVTTNDTQHPNWTQYPYYLDVNYKIYYFNMIESFGNFLRTLPTNLFSKIAYVQVKTGCTGDEVAYKGTPLNSSYTISDNQWRVFRLEVFEKFRLTFNTGNSSTQIGLLFNNIDPVDEPIEWQWVTNNVTYGFGTKGGAYARGHHLSDELDFKTTWTPYLVNPQGLHLFSAAEMDQTWTKPLYQINVPLGFYWGALSGLNTGLSVWLVTQSALQEAQSRPELHDVFKLFNKYSKQMYPSTADVAYTIFHEGLNSQNTVKFPENIYGQANQSNQARYAAICNAYSARGAQMDHVFAATKGQVWQRDQQTGYNDAGWNIEEGNYERWITQINPEATSIGLFRVRGVINASSSKYDRFARSFENSSGKNTMYFKFHSDVFTLSDPASLTFKITWLDKNINSTWALKYYNSAGLQTAINITGIGDNQWKTTIVTIENPIITQNGDLGSDFMLVNTDNIDDIFHGIEVDIIRTGTPPAAPVVSASGTTANSTSLTWTTATDNIGITSYDVLKDNTLLTSTTANNLNVTGLSPATAYTFTVKAKDAAGNASVASNALVVNTLAPDLTAPAAPTLTASGTTVNTTTLSWSGATDNYGITGYDVYQGAVLIGSTSSTTYPVVGLSAFSTYTFSIKSKDAANNISVASNTVSVTTLQGTYCPSQGNSVVNELIGNVTLGTINNTSTGGSGYTDFTNISTTLAVGTTQTISITPTWTGTVYAEGYAVFIDYNRDGDFLDSGETVFTNAATTATPINGIFTIPLTATIGATRMRVSLKYNGIPSACETFQFGQVEDYSINFIPASTTLNLKLFIEGYYDTATNLMKPVIANQGVGSSTTNVDDITVELRDATTYNTIASTTAVLKTNGTANCLFSSSYTGNYFIVIKHRSAVQTWSNLPVSFSSASTSFDFSTAAAKAFGSNMTVVAPGVYAFYNGDINQDEIIDNSDSDTLFFDIETSNFGFLNTDLNGDGSVDNSDTDSFFVNVENSIFSNHP